MLALLIACTQDADGPVSFPEARVDGFETRFKLHSQGWEPTPAQAFALRDACPVVEKAQIEMDGPHGVLQLWGRLDGVDRLVVQLGGGHVAESRARPADEGSLRFAVACRDCELVPGFAAEGRMIGCRGPGHSIVLVDGEISPQP